MQACRAKRSCAPTLPKTDQDFERPFAQFVLVWSIGAPLAMAYLWLQVLSLARFNKQIFEWALTTRDNDVYRALHQNQTKMTFSVFGFTITLQRIRVTVVSFVVGVLLKFVTQMVMDAAKNTGTKSAVISDSNLLNPKP